MERLKHFVFLILLFAASAGAVAQSGRGRATPMHTVPKGVYEPFFRTAATRPVPVAAFRLDEYAVTNAEFIAFVKQNPAWRRSRVNRLFADKNYLHHWATDTTLAPADAKLLQAPVVSVSWFAAQAYAKWQGKRLPTVAEWELAGNGKPRNIRFDSLTDYILDWYKRPNPKVLPPVKSTYVNQYGLYDMHGLIWEWTFNFNSFVGSTDSRGNTTDEVQAFCAAGAVNVKDKTDYAGFMRYGYRGSLKGNFCIQNLGFRCAKSI